MRHCSAYCACSRRYSAWRSGNKGKGGLNTTANDPRSQMIPTIDHNQSPTANDFRVLPQMVLPKNAEFRRLTLQKVIIFLVYFSSPACMAEGRGSLFHPWPSGSVLASFSLLQTLVGFLYALRWLDWIFWGWYLPTLSINYVGMSKDMEKKVTTTVLYKDENFFWSGFYCNRSRHGNVMT